MVGAISSNGLISGLYGAGLIRAVRPSASPSRGPATGAAHTSDPGLINLDPDSVEISPAARQAARDLEQSPREGVWDRAGDRAASTLEPDSTDLSGHGRAELIPRKELTPQEQEQLRKLEQRDREVRAHEEAHRRAAGPHATGGPAYKYEVGPDGRRYAVDGEVQIDTSPVPDDPGATIRKMQQVRRAALAPAEPSDQDRQVAAQAMAAEQQARAELARQRPDEEGPATASPGGPAASGDAFDLSIPAAEPAPSSAYPAVAGSVAAVRPNGAARPTAPAPIAERYAPYTATGMYLDATA